MIQTITTLIGLYQHIADYLTSSLEINQLTCLFGITLSNTTNLVHRS